MQPTNAQAIFYLDFVAAAYAMYASDPTNLTPAAIGLPTGYAIQTYMTSVDPASGVQVFFGFIAVNPNDPGLPGILAIRGTANPYEWITDLDLLPAAFPPIANAYVATGFYEFVQGIQWIVASDGSALQSDAVMTADAYPQGFVVVGHSLGGAMATLLMATWMSAIPSLLLTLVTAASPAVGDYAFYSGFYECTQGISWRYINELDTVASAYDLIYYQVSQGIAMISYDIYPTPACEHSLLTYLYLLSPAGTPCTGACCIFDEDAKTRIAALGSQRRADRLALRSNAVR
jgi:triacylglycerol lipase